MRILNGIVDNPMPSYGDGPQAEPGD